MGIETLLMLLSVMLLCADARAAVPIPDTSPHKVQFVTVAAGVKLEVLDWGGRGPPMLFLSGLGDTAHVFDSFAPKFTDRHHVYGITRRGFGKSSTPPLTEENYLSDRLGDDVFAVIETLKLSKPVVLGHSIAGEELSSLATRHPESVRALIYLEAAYARAFYYYGKGDSAEVDLDVARRELNRLVNAGPQEGSVLVKDLKKSIANLQKGLGWYSEVFETPTGKPDPPLTESYRVGNAILSGEQKYGNVKKPILAIFAIPQRCKSNCNAHWRKTWERVKRSQIEAFRHANPSAAVLQLPNASHYVYRSNETEVTEEMNAFIDGLH